MTHTSRTPLVASFGASFLASFLAAAVASTLTGCFWVTTKSEGETLRKDLTLVQGRLDAKERTLDDQVAQLQKVLEDATKVLKRNSADIGADVDGLRNDVRTANGLVTAINNSVNEMKAAQKATADRLDALDQRLAALESGKASASSGPDDLWKLGSAAFEAQRYNEAIDIFKRLNTSYPTHDKADDSVYFRGQAYSNLKDWDHAIGVYQQLYDKYPASDLADDGLYFAALAAQQLKNCTEARTYLGLIKQKYAKSNVSKQATELDAALKRDLKNKSKCSS